MRKQIHPSAIVDPAARLEDDVEIGPLCVVGPHVHLGRGVRLKSHVVVDGHTVLGAGCTVYPFASLGSAPQDLKFAGEDSRLVIGENNTIREHVTMNPGTKGGAMETRVGNNGLFMVGSHIAHDCVIGNNVIMANNATLGGHVQVGDFAVLGGLSAVHQFVRIGEHAMIGGMSGVESDVIPYGRVKGERAFLAGLNLIGMERRGFSRDQIRVIQKAVNHLFCEAGTLEERMSEIETDYADEDTVRNIVRFAREKTRFPLCPPPR